MYRRLAPLGAVFLLLCWAAPAGAQNGGYSGLIAPSKSETENSAPQNKQAPAGYYGVVGGDAKAPVYQPAQNKTPAADEPQAEPEVSAVPDAPKVFIPQSATDLKALADIEEMRKARALRTRRNDAEEEQLSAEEVETLSRPMRRVDGKLPTTHMAEVQIEALFADLQKKNLSGAAYSDAMRQIRVQLTTSADALRRRQSIPDKSYLKIGVPQQYLAEKKTDNAEALSLYDDAIKQLKEF